MQEQALIPHLFRTEYSKITAVLCRLFGMAHISIAEDIANDTFLLAVETWAYNGYPPNPTAWLYAVAKNNAKNYFARNKIFSQKVASGLKHTALTSEEIEVDLSEQNISDSQLQMLFAICHPAISKEAQIGLALRILCGFGIDEIADAFLSNRETINKRLFRAKEKLRAEKVKIELPDAAEINARLQTVATTLYLLFNEGYYSESKDAVIRKDLCLEAMRLTYLLVSNTKTKLHFINALLALMCFHASRIEARKNESGQIILYPDQDETLWDQTLIATGKYYFGQASQGNGTSTYHLEAGIAYWHTMKTDTPEKWDNILQLYNALLQLEYSPIAALNRTFAFSKVHGKEKAIIEGEKLKLNDNHFYFTLLGELYKGIDNGKAKTNFQTAYKLAKTQSDKKLLHKYLGEVD